MTVDVAPSPFATVDPASNIGSHVHNGEDYYTRGLRARFLIDEDKAAAAAKSEPAADIEYGFDKEKFFARSKARVAAGGLAPDLPNGFPKAMEGPMVWTGKDFDDTADCPEYVMMLSDDDKREIFAAVKHFIGEFDNCARPGLSHMPLSLPSAQKRQDKLRVLLLSATEEAECSLRVHLPAH